MPAMPIESVSPPEELEDNWPLQAHGDALELPDAAGAKKKNICRVGKSQVRNFMGWSCKI